MKYVFATIAAVAALTFGSCKKCYDCEITETVAYDDEDFNDFFGYSTTRRIEKCDRKSEIEAYEAENTATYEATDFWGSYSFTSTATCSRN